MLREYEEHQYGGQGRPGLPLTKLSYLRGYDRCNLLSQLQYVRSAAGEAGLRLVSSQVEPRLILALGREVAYALGLPRRANWHAEYPLAGGHRVWLVPHPSGMCRVYNDRAERLRVGALMSRLREEAGSCSYLAR